MAQERLLEDRTHRLLLEFGQNDPVFRLDMTSRADGGNHLHIRDFSPLIRVLIPNACSTRHEADDPGARPIGASPQCRPLKSEN